MNTRRALCSRLGRIVTFPTMDTPPPAARPALGGRRQWLPLGLVVLVASTLAVLLGGSTRPAAADVIVVVPGCAVAPADVIAWWRGEGDLSAAIGPDANGSAAFEPGLIGDAIRFSGANTVTVPDFPTVTDAVSIDMWIRPAATGRPQVLASRWDFPSDRDDAGTFALLLIGDELVWQTDEISTMRPEELRVVAPGLYDGDFHHVAATWGQTEMALYVDGVLVGSKPSQGGTLNPALATEFRLGSKVGIGDPLRYTGVMDEPAVYRRALTAAQVDGLVAAGPGGKCTGADGLVGPGLQVEADRGGVAPIISATGRYVLFGTRSSDVFPVVTDPALQTPGTDLDLLDDARDDVVLLDTKNTNTPTDDTIELISVGTDGLGGALDSGGGALTPTGSHVVFWSISDDLVAGDTLPGRDLFVRNRLTGTTQRVNVRSDGSQPEFTATGTNNINGAPSISDSGTVIAFESTNRDLVPEAAPVPGDTWQTSDIYVRDTSAPDPGGWVTERITVGFDGSKADGSSSGPIMSPDGRYVWFTSHATNLVAGDTNGHADLFRFDRQTDTMVRVNVTGGTGLPLDGDVLLADVSPNGRYVAFSSAASTIVAGDTNGLSDAFVLDTQVAAQLGVAKMSPPGGGAGNGPSFAMEVSPTGRYVLMESSASNLVPGDTNGLADLFVADRTSGSIDRVSVDVGGMQRDGASTGVTATNAMTTIVYTYQQPGDGLFTIWRSSVRLG